MKKIISFILALVCLFFALCSCGNRGYGFGNFSFKHIHISDDINGYCATIEKWYETEYSGIEVKTKEYGAIWCSEGTYTMFEGKENCPYCN